MYELDDFAYRIAAASAAHLGDVERPRATMADGERLRPFSAEAFEAFSGYAEADVRERLLDGLRKAGWEG